jgi:hypothetical protein
MPRTEDDPRDDVGKGEVGRRRHRPAARHGIIGVRTKHRGEPEIDGDGREDTTGRGEERRHRLAPAHRPVAQDDGFPDLLGRNREEQRHQHVVDEEMRRQDPPHVAELADTVGRPMDPQPVGRVHADQPVEPERIVDDETVAGDVDIGPHKRDHRARDQQDRVVGDEIPNPVHACPPAPTAIAGIRQGGARGNSAPDGVRR